MIEKGTPKQVMLADEDVVTNEILNHLNMVQFLGEAERFTHSSGAMLPKGTIKSLYVAPLSKFFSNKSMLA